MRRASPERRMCTLSASRSCRNALVVDFTNELNTNSSRERGPVHCSCCGMSALLHRSSTYAEVEGNHAEDTHNEQGVALLLVSPKAWAARERLSLRSSESVAMNHTGPQKLKNDVDRLLELVGHASSLARCVKCLANGGLVMVVVNEAVWDKLINLARSRLTLAHRGSAR